MLRNEVYDPVSTCRIQFSKDFTFDDLRTVIPYLQKLGIRTIYASPVFKAVPGSGHGYDIIDPGEINPEIGTIEKLRALNKELRKRSMGWLQDIVPNHMAYDPQNAWISDIFRNGPRSEYYTYFDIDWEYRNEDLKGKVMLPFFGKPVGQLMEDNELNIRFSEEGGFVLSYFDKDFPLSYRSWQLVLNAVTSTTLIPGLGKAASDIEASQFTEGAGIFEKLYHEDAEVKHLVENSLQLINNDKARLGQVIMEQFYLPAYWKESEKRINYRRFFTINGLISLRMEDERVFTSWHRLTDELIKEKTFNGLRVDHIDGLLDPEQYLRRLRNASGEHTYIIVEKILKRNEKLKSGWPVQGNTGYDFGTLIANLFTNEIKAREFNDIYNRWDENRPDYGELVYDKKHFIIFNRMAGDLDNLVHICLSLPGIPGPHPGKEKLAEAIAEFLIQCPVYKIYPTSGTFEEAEKDFIRTIFARALRHKPGLAAELNFLRELFLYTGKDLERREAGMRFFLRCMQFTGPLMAKGLEDTAFYSYAQFIAHNEVGDSPGYFGIQTGSFHAQMKERLRESPLSLNATSTHDSKRGEDSRARLTVISDIPDLWEQFVFEWRKYGEELRRDNAQIPTPNDEYFIYQSLAGSYPPELTHDDTFRERFNAFILKMIREAKENTSWSRPDEEYEKLTVEFAENLLRHEKFMQSFRQFLGIIRDPGMICSLSQVLLRNTCPGVPDLYRGSEVWNFSFVDPDNRRPVDFGDLSSMLDKVIRSGKKNKKDFYEKLWAERAGGGIKLWLTWLTLKERLASPEFFRTASYIPLTIKGKYRDNLMAFLRYRQRRWYLVAVPVKFAGLLPDDSRQLKDINWRSTRIQLPELSPVHWENILTGENHSFGRSIPADVIFSHTDLAFLKAEETGRSRSAGILLHISSLPGKYGTGDMGGNAFDFVDFLQRNGQSCWQILPLNYVDRESAFSPYSCLSAFAGNIILLDPDLLREAGLLTDSDTGNGFDEEEDNACFEKALDFRLELLAKAWNNFKAGDMPILASKFRDFCEKERPWLDDFALFILFRELNEGKKWNEWPVNIRDRDEETLLLHRDKYHERLDELKFFQFLFFEQWNDLKTYANDRGIKIIGDMPFYINFDSADVWANSSLFRLGEDKKMETMAGVPPDYFNDEGQLWRMPVYRWDLMKKRGYAWWKQRLSKNLELFDLVRIDHFRAFSDYWEVPAGEETAVNGSWIKGPGEDFFNSMKKEFPGLPFIAEDLGDVNQAVYDLRDKFQLPGMSVLQFAFGDDMAGSVHTPHNHRKNSVVYTGTHDNNTLKGWYRYELNRRSKRRLRYYTGKRINSRNCNAELIRLAFMSAAETVIIPMQDYLGLDRHARMNKPSTRTGNWTWRMEADDILAPVEKMIQRYTRVFGRSG